MSTGKDCSWAGRTGTFREMEAVGGKSLPTLNKVGFGTALNLMWNPLSVHFRLPRHSVSLRAAEWRWGKGNPVAAISLGLASSLEGIVRGPAESHHSHGKKALSQWSDPGNYSWENQNGLHPDRLTLLWIFCVICFTAL